MKRFLLIAGLGLCLVAGIVRADAAATEALLDQLRDLEQVQGRFEQRQLAEGGALLAESSGRFSLLRPGYFAWEITAPDSQLIIADPEHLWHHDRDLETVTRRPVAGREELSPLQVLGGDEDLLRQRFRVEQGAEGWFVLTPLEGDPGFQRLELRLDNGTLVDMRILDSLNQQVEVTFSEVDSATTLTPEDFAFTPPEGADLFYHDQ